MELSQFQRSGESRQEISESTYHFLIGLVLCWGFFVNWAIVQNVSTQWIRGINPWVFYISYFALCFGGSKLFQTSDKPALSFLGYNMVVVPFGFIVNLVVSRYDSHLVTQALQITALVTVSMTALGAVFPSFFSSISLGLSLALILVILVELFQIFVLGIHQGWLDWAVVLIFCGYIGYDWGKAAQLPKTVDNAIDSAARIYMDVINLFLRILRILGRKK